MLSIGQQTLVTKRMFIHSSKIFNQSLWERHEIEKKLTQKWMHCQKNFFFTKCKSRIQCH